MKYVEDFFLTKFILYSDILYVISKPPCKDTFDYLRVYCIINGDEPFDRTIK